MRPLVREPTPSRILLATPGAGRAAPSPAQPPDSAPDGADGVASTTPRDEVAAVAVLDAPAAEASHVVIDITDRPITVSVPAPARMRRVWIALGVLIVLTVALAVTNYVNGMQWRSQALAAQSRAARAAADVAAEQDAVVEAQAARDAAELRREAMARQLAVSEADVAALEARVSKLANDKAQAEDKGDDAAPVTSEAQIRSLRTQLDSCVAQVAALRAAMLVGDGSSIALDDAARAAQASCDQAGADVAELAVGR